MIRGERFELNLSDSEDEAQQPRQPMPAAFVGDVLERKPAAPKPPSAPTLKNKTGFPEHKKRTVESRFKKQKSASEPKTKDVLSKPSSVGEALSGGNAKSWEEEEKQRIDQENQQKIAAMSPEEIEEERKELLNSFGAGLLERLLKRSNIDTGSNEVDLSRPMGVEDGEEEVKPERTKPKTTKTVKFEEPVVDEEPESAPEADPPKHKHDDGHHHNDGMDDSLPQHDTVHFPNPPQPPELDPSSKTFLEDLHQKYFPSLPSDPDKLEWMQPTSAKDNTYSPNATAFNAKDIRFSFRGELIPPKMASEIPVTEGLHHHGDAPDAAGYTIAELAHLSRSTYPAQRCIAFQTLGRILYRLSKGEFGDAGEPGADRFGSEDTFGELARGLWREVERLKVIQGLVEESEGRGVDGGRHLSAKTYATEAVWLWRKGGGRRWKAE